MKILHVNHIVLTILFMATLQSCSENKKSSSEKAKTEIRDTSIAIISESISNSENQNKAIVNSDYLKNLRAEERAALAYLFTFFSVECAENKMENEKNECFILRNLEIDYQCSPKHLDLLKAWFESDTAVIQSLNHCPILPETEKVTAELKTIELVWNNSLLELCYYANFYHQTEDRNRELHAKIVFENGDFGLKLISESRLSKDDFYAND